MPQIARNAKIITVVIDIHTLLLNEYYLLYGTNTTTGYTGYYLYDKKENTVQRYNTDILDKVTKEKDKYLSIVIVLSCVCFLTMLFLLIEINKKRND